MGDREGCKLGVRKVIERLKFGVKWRFVLNIMLNMVGYSTGINVFLILKFM